MSIPTYDKFIEPVLRFLAAHPEGVLARDAYEAAARTLGLSDDERQELLPSGNQEIYKNRVGWAHDRLKRNGLSSSPKRGRWQITEDGLRLSREHPLPFSDEEIDNLASANLTISIRERSSEVASALPREEITTSISSATPDERFAEALAEIRRSVADEILEYLSNVSPSFFERVVLDVLNRMGYGASPKDVQMVGGSGDGGIDGIISLDKLGLEKVYVQAKRWKNTVQRPDVQGFYGALAGLRARKGVFMTTSSYSPGAVEFARSVEGIVLVDGAKLAQLMIDHEVGVSLKSVHVPRIDSDYFDG